jgi:hypothetical protein
MGVLIQANFGRAASTIDLPKRQFADHPKVRRSSRWVEQRVAEGMPSYMDGNRRMFPLEKCLAWLKDRERGAA